MNQITLTPEQAPRVAALIEAELAACSAPYCGTLGSPSHFSGYLTNGTFVNNSCESRGRHLVANLTFTGNAHCTCDSCF